MDKNDVDRKEELKIAMVEITIDGKVIWSKAVFVDDDIVSDIEEALFYYDEAK